MKRIRTNAQVVLAITALIFTSGLYSGPEHHAQVELAETRDLFVTALGAARPNIDGTARYKIDASKSHFMVKAFAGGLLSAFAHDHNISIPDFSGEAQFTYGTFEPASLRLTVKANSLAVTDKVSEKDKNEIENTMRNQVLEVEKYPEIVFTSTSVSASKVDEGKYQVKINGELSLHGATHTVVVNARVELSANSLHAHGEIPLRQTTYGIKPVSAAGGTIKVKDDVKLTFNIVAYS